MAATPRTLVTGGTGFLGRHLVDQLLSNGHQPGDLRVLCRRGDRSLSERGVEVVQGSILDERSLATATQGCSLVFHAAGAVDRSPVALGSLMRVHVSGTRNVLLAAKQANAGRVVYVSTSGTIGASKRDDVVANEHSPYPLDVVRSWPYYLSKIYAEQTAFELARDEDIDLVCINPALLLGPGDTRLSSTEDVLRFLRRQVPAIPSGGISFVDVRDAAAATLAAAEKGKAGQRYLLTAANWPLEKFFRRLESIAGVPGPSLKIPDGAARLSARLMKWGAQALGREAAVDRISVEMSQHFWYVDAKRAMDTLSFTPRDPDATLQATVDDLRGRYGLV